jgi:hypothetical protein
LQHCQKTVPLARLAVMNASIHVRMLHWVNGQITDQRKGCGCRVSFCQPILDADPRLRG